MVNLTTNTFFDNSIKLEVFGSIAICSFLIIILFVKIFGILLFTKINFEIVESFKLKSEIGLIKYFRA